MKLTPSQLLSPSNATRSSSNPASGNSPSTSGEATQPKESDSHCSSLRAKGSTPQLEALLCSLEKFCYYEPASGEFIVTRTRQGSHLQPGDYIEHRDQEGYARVHVNGKTYKAHNLAWLWMTGTWSTNQIDHLDRNNYNNAWSNLRDVTVSENHYNKGPQKNNIGGVPGVQWVRRASKWQVSLQVAGKKIHGGYFFNFEDAVAARKTLEAKYLGGFNG